MLPDQIIKVMTMSKKSITMSTPSLVGRQCWGKTILPGAGYGLGTYESFATVGEIRVYWRADFQSGSRVLKKVF